jgi:hypothetical protein
VDWAVIRSSILAGLIVIVPAALVSQWLSSGDDGWTFFFLLVVLLGFVIAGFGAGYLRSDTPMKHGAIAAVGCYAVVQLFGMVKRLIAGESINPVTYILMAFLAASFGLVGGLFGDWHRRRSRRP